MGLGRTIALIIFLVLNFILAIFLESQLKANYAFELVVIVIGILLSIALLLGMSFEALWAWPVATILFSAFLANAVFLYVASSAFIVFTALVLVNTLGLLTSVLSINEPDAYLDEQVGAHDAGQLETYDPAANSQVSYVNAPKRKAAKKSSKRKKKR